MRKEILHNFIFLNKHTGHITVSPTFYRRPNSQQNLLQLRDTLDPSDMCLKIKDVPNFLKLIIRNTRL